MFGPCGRVHLSSDVSQIKIVFSIPPHRPTLNFPASWNVAPTDPLPVIRYDRKAGERSLDILRWGRVRYWAKDIKLGFANINAMAKLSTRSRPFAKHSSDVAVWCRGWLLRMEKDCDLQAAVCNCAGRPTSDGLGRPMGELALAGG
jgi:putative SOS response-associated peptidase YedK